MSFTRYVISKCCHLVAKSCPTLLQPHGLKPLGSSVHGILQARLLEWAASPFSRGSYINVIAIVYASAQDLLHVFLAYVFFLLLNL